MMDKSTVSSFLLLGAIILISTVAGKYIKQNFIGDENADDYRLIKKYLLNENNLYRANKPNLWIHTKYEYNARRWKSFGSRNSYDLNQPYLHLTIRSIIYHCSANFNICLIDDDSFMRLIPGWEHDLSKMAEPFRTHYRELGLLSILYEYGGMLVPNSFLCFRNLIQLYKENEHKPFIAENLSRTTNVLEYMPDFHFMGAKKKDPTVEKLVDYITSRNRFPHYTSEFDLKGDVEKWIMTRVQMQMIRLLPCSMIGAMTIKKQPIRLDNLMEEDYLELPKTAFGIYIPADEILRRPKYQWFANLEVEEVLRGSSILSKYFMNVFDEILREDNKQESGEVKNF